jgi:hypothetical protein
VVVRLGDGREYSIIFVDIQRLSQMLDDQIAAGYCCYAEPGLIFVAEVNRINMEAAVRELIKDKFFDSLRTRE